MATAETKRIGGKWFVIGFVLVAAVTVTAFLTIQFSGRGAAKRNYLALSFTAGLRDLDEGFYVDAVKNLNPVVESGDEPAAVGLRGEAYLRMKKYAEAERDFRRAIELEPSLPANHAGLGAALAGLGRHADALPCFDQAAALFEKAATPPGRVRRTGDTPAEVRRLRDAAQAPAT